MFQMLALSIEKWGTFSFKDTFYVSTFTRYAS